MWQESKRETIELSLKGEVLEAIVGGVLGEVLNRVNEGAKVAGALNM